MRKGSQMGTQIFSEHAIMMPVRRSISHDFIQIEAKSEIDVMPLND